MSDFLPFAYESTGVESRFTSTIDSEPRSREVSFHRPETLMNWAGKASERTEASTLRHGVRPLPRLDEDGWRFDADVKGDPYEGLL